MQVVADEVGCVGLRIYKEPHRSQLSPAVLCVQLVQIGLASVELYSHVSVWPLHWHSGVDSKNEESKLWISICTVNWSCEWWHQQGNVGDMISFLFRHDGVGCVRLGVGSHLSFWFAVFCWKHQKTFISEKKLEISICIISSQGNRCLRKAFDHTNT